MSERHTKGLQNEKSPMSHDREDKSLLITV
nr:MAG TPA: hypothetical protein [Caudoviricetes sp.]